MFNEKGLNLDSPTIEEIMDEKEFNFFKNDNDGPTTYKAQVLCFGAFCILTQANPKPPTRPRVYTALPHIRDDRESNKIWSVACEAKDSHLLQLILHG